MSKERIKNILLNSNNKYIMGTGGEGIEFFSHLFSVPPKYSNYPVFVSDTNRTNVIICKFFDLLGSTILYSGGDIDDLAFKMFSNLSNYENIEEILSSGEKTCRDNFIFRMHFNNNRYFKNNTYFIFLDTYEWFEYKWAMWFEKVWTFPVDFQYYLNVYNHRVLRPKLENNHNLINNFLKLKNLIDLHKPQNLTEGYFSYLDFIDYVPDNYLEFSIRDLINLARNKINKESYDAYLRKVSTIPCPKINFTDIIKHNAFQDIFDYHDDSVITKISNWHIKNLTLMERSGYDIFKYK